MKILVTFVRSDLPHRAFTLAVNSLKMSSGVANSMVLAVAHPPESAGIVEVDAILDGATQHYEDLFSGRRDPATSQNIEMKTGIVVGHPAQQIARYAADNGCDMIVVGQRGRSKIQTWLHGSASKRRISHAPCTVVVVK